jgi:predicted ATPase
VLGDTATAPQFLATVRGQGYRFLGDLHQSVSFALPTPDSIVGREEELTLLARVLSDTEQASRRVVFITGEFGIGKTALLETFVQRLAPRERYWLMQGSGIESYGAGEPYLPFFSAFGDLARGREAPAVTALLRHTAPTWLAQMPWLVSPTDRTILARELPAVTTPQMLRELAEILETMARQRPMLFVLEDMHWSDQASIAALAYLARRLAPSRLLFLVTYRPEDAALRQHPVDALRLELCTHRLAETMMLHPLGETGIVAYLRQRFGVSDLPEMLPQRLYQQTEGHPLFLVTLVDDLVTRGVLAQEGSAWQVQGILAEDLQAVPSTLQALVLHRLRRLSIEEQRVLRAGSVAGVEFAAALAAPGGSATLATEAVCEGLAQRGLFLEPRGVSTWPDGTITQRFRFRHALYQHVIYAHLPAGERSRLHRAIGARLEHAFEGHADNIAAALAMHFDQGGDDTRACQYSLHAAEHALGRSAHVEVIAHCTRGLAFLTRVRDSHTRTRRAIGLHTLLGHALTATRGFAAPEVEQAYTQARALCIQAGETRRQLPVLRGLWSWCLVRAEYARAQAIGTEILRVATRLHDPGGLLEGHRTLGATLFFLGDFTAARTHLAWVVAHYAPEQQQRHTREYGYNPKVAALCYLAYILWFIGAADQALQHVQEASALAEALQQPFNQVFAWAAAATVHQLRREVPESLAYAEKALALSREQGFAFWAAQEAIQHGWAMAMQGESVHGVAAMRAGLAAYQATGAAHWWSHWQALLAEGAVHADQDEEALAALAEALRAVTDRQERFYEAEVYRLRGEVLGRRTAAGEAAGETCFQRALVAARRDGARALELRTALSLSRLWQCQGKHSAAYELLRDVYSQFTEGWETADLQEAKQCLETLEMERVFLTSGTVPVLERSWRPRTRDSRVG